MIFLKRKGGAQQKVGSCLWVIASSLYGCHSPWSRKIVVVGEKITITYKQVVKQIIHQKIQTNLLKSMGWIPSILGI
jgi:hypothetical protein